MSEGHNAAPGICFKVTFCNCLPDNNNQEKKVRLEHREIRMPCVLEVCGLWFKRPVWGNALAAGISFRRRLVEEMGQILRRPESQSMAGGGYVTAVLSSCSRQGTAHHRCASSGGKLALELRCERPGQLRFSGPPEPMLHLSLTEIQVRHKINPPATFKWLSSYFQWKHSGLAVPTKSSVAPLFALCKIFLDPWCLHLCASSFHYDCWPSEAHPQSFNSYDRNSSTRKS